MQIIHTLHNSEQLPLALTIGNFDGVHRGHRAILETLATAAHERNLIPAAMTFSPHVKVFFRSATNFLICSDEEKSQYIAQSDIKKLYQVHFDKAFSLLSPEQFIDTLVKELNVKYLLIGDDFQFGHKGKGNFEFLLNYLSNQNIVVKNTKTIDYDSIRVSSSRIRTAITNSEFDLVKTLLGRALTYKSIVQHGKQLGRTISFPTANLHFDESRLLPSGVFAVKIGIEGDSHKHFGMCNIGTNPTVDNDKTRKLEVHIFDFTSDIYGKQLTVEPLAKIRDECKFDGVEQLLAQLHKDKEQAQTIIGK